MANFNDDIGLPRRAFNAARNIGLGKLWYYISHPKITMDAGFRWLTIPLRPLPDFIIIGANKCGTTSLYEYVTQHPKIKGGIFKELHFFDRYSRYKKGLRWYRYHFPIRVKSDAFQVGEATPEYLFNPAVPKRIYEVIPNAKFIVLMRNPVDRALSHYQHSKRAGVEDLPFEEALRREKSRIESVLKNIEKNPKYENKEYEQYSYLSRGRYEEQIKRWLRYFSKDQFIFLKSENLFNNPQKVSNEVFDFLNVRRFNIEKKKAYNSGNYDEEISPKLKNKMEKYFEKGNSNLEKVLGKSIDWW